MIDTNRAFEHRGYATRRTHLMPVEAEPALSHGWRLVAWFTCACLLVAAWAVIYQVAVNLVFPAVVWLMEHLA